MKVSTRMVRMQSGYIINEIMKNIIKFVQEFEILIMLIYKNNINNLNASNDKEDIDDLHNELQTNRSHRFSEVIKNLFWM